MTTITLKELHADTGEIARRAGNVNTPVFITDRGRVIAAICNPSMVKTRTKKRVLLPEFKRHMAGSSKGLLKDALNAVRGDY